MRNNYSKDIKNDCNKKPWLSIVIPVYNSEKYLDQCIQSILSQSFYDFEVIFVDDGSMDDSSEICLSYQQKDNRLHYYRTANRGSYHARIYGANLAKGEYITFCDSDDYYIDKTVFSILFKYVQEYECAILQFGYKKKYNHLSKKVRMTDKDYYVSHESFLMKEYPKLICSFWDESHLTLNVWNKLYHKSLIKKLPAADSAEHVFWGDDLIMNLFLLHGEVTALYIPICLYVYREFSGKTTSFNPRTMNDLDCIKRSQLKFLSDREDRIILEPIIHSETANWFFIWVCEAIKYMNKNELKEALSVLLQLPGFKAAREYYLIHRDDANEAVELLRESDPERYVERAVQLNLTNNRLGIKGKIVSLLKRVYKVI